MPLYETSNPYARARGLMSDASQTTAAMDKKDPEAPKPGIGGGIMSAAGGALTATAVGSVLAPAAGAEASLAAGLLTGGTGLAIGAGIGLLAYYLS